MLRGFVPPGSFVLEDLFIMGAKREREGDAENAGADELAEADLEHEGEIIRKGDREL